jgi:hypothetical protein
MEFLLKMPKKKEKHANPNFTTSSKLQYYHYWFDGTGGVFSRDRSILAAAGIVGLAFGFEVNILSEILFLVFYYS